MVEKLKTLNESQTKEVKDLMKKYSSDLDSLQKRESLWIKKDTIQNLQIFLKTQGLYKKAIDSNIWTGTKAWIKAFMEKDTWVIKWDSTWWLDYNGVVEKKLDLKRVIEEIQTRPILKMLKLNIDKNIWDIALIKKVYEYLSTQSNEINKDWNLKWIANDEWKIAVYLKTEQIKSWYSTSTKVIDSVIIDPKTILKNGNTNKELDENKFLSQLIVKIGTMIDTNSNNIKNSIEQTQLKNLEKVEKDFTNAKVSLELWIKNKSWSNDQYKGWLRNMKQYIDQATLVTVTYWNAQHFKEELVFNMKQDLKKITQQVKNLVTQWFDNAIS